MSGGGRGQLLMPWPNRIRDGRYSFGGRDLQLGLTDPSKGNASHGLARWAAWTLEEHTDTSVSLVYRVMAQSGYPWTLDLHVLYDLSADGLVVTQTATNLSPEPAPYASGAHPYLAVGDAIEDLELTVPARTRMLFDDRQLPVGTEPVVGGVRLHHTPPHRRRAARRRLRRPRARGRARHRDAARPGDRARRRAVGRRAPPVAAALHAAGVDGVRTGLAVEPMTAPADAFNSGTDLVTLAPAGSRRRRAVGVVGHPRPATRPECLALR